MPLPERLPCTCRPACRTPDAPVTPYARRKAAGRCGHCGSRPADPGVVLCAACREQGRLRKAAWVQAHPAEVRARTARDWDAKYLAPGPNLLGCCGRWHDIDNIPFTTSCCGTIFFQEEPDVHN